MKSDEQLNQSSQEARRDFIKTATKLSGIVALLGIPAESFATILTPQATPTQTQDSRISAIQLIFNDAIDSGDMTAAVNKYRRRARLNENQAKALMSITGEELTALKSLRGKLVPLNISDLAVMTSGSSSNPRPESGPIPPYGEAIRGAQARGDLQEMRNTAAGARKWLADATAALEQLESSIKKAGG